MTQKQSPEAPPAQAGFPDAHDILDHAPIGIFKTTPEGRFLYANKALSEMYGYDSPLDMVTSVQDIASELFADPTDGPAVASLLATEGTVKGYECEHIRKDGIRFWASGSIRAVYVEDGSVSHYQGFVICITERKQAEEALRESEEHFRTLFMDTPVSMIIQRPGNGEIIDANPVAWLQYGLSSLDELKTYEFWLEPPYSLADVQAWMRRAEQEGTQSFEWCSRKKNGDLLWEHVQLTPIAYLGRGAILVTGIDISRRKRSEEALSKSRTIMNQAEELAALGSWEWNIYNDTWLLSENFKKIHGVSDIQLTTSQLLPIAHPEDRPAIEEAFATATENGEPYDIEHRIVRQDTGEVRTVHSRVLVEMDSNGKPKAMVGAVQDITNLKQAHNLLVESEARFRSLFENSPVAYQSLNEEGCYIDVNDMLSELLGYERSEILGKDFGELWSKRTRNIYPATFEKFKYSGCVKGELELIHKSGSALFVLLEGRTQRDPDGKFIRTHCILYDITERKKAEEEIRTINEQLQKSNAEKEKLFSIIAHDLKSPMSGLVGSTQMLAMEPELFSEQDFRFLATEMHKNARNTFELLDDLLQWARMSQGGMVFAPTPCSLNDLMTMGLSTGQDMARVKDIAIRRDVPQGLTVLADQPMLKTVIRNILFNAIKFTHRGGEIVIRARQEGRTATVAIQDNGIGMNEQVVFTVFTLNKDKCHLGTEGEKGTGLGLVMCKQFIEQHGGEIWVESELGLGTTVFFTLPTQETRTPQTAEPLNR